MIPLFPDDELPVRKKDERPPTAMFTIAALARDGRDWLALYAFFYEGQEGTASFIVGPVSALTEQEALAKTLDPKSSFINRAQQAFLRAIKLETRH